MDDLAPRLRHAVMHLHRRLRQSYGGGLSPAQVSLLATVARLGSPTLGDLALTEQMRPPSMTRLARATADAGFISFTADPADGRVTRVSMTEAGQRELATVRASKTAFLEKRIAALSATERERLGELTTLLEHLLEHP
jgi:DNA-binding MarR family transcriptional regulator